MLVYGAVGWMMTAELSKRIGVRQEEPHKGESFLEGEGAAKTLDFYLHSHLFVSKTQIPIAAVNERINESQLKEVPREIAAARQSQPLGKLSQHTTSSKCIRPPKNKSSRRLTENVDPHPKPTNITVHSCFTRTLTGVRTLCQLMYLLPKLYGKIDYNIFTFKSNGSLHTNTKYKDASWMKGDPVMACCCFNSNNNKNDNEDEISYEEYMTYLHKQLDKLSKSKKDKEINAKFPGLHEETPKKKKK